MTKVLSPAQVVKKAQDKSKREALETLFAWNIQTEQLAGSIIPDPSRQFKIPNIPYIYDFAWPAFSLVVEINGGTHAGDSGKKSGHSTGKGIQRDYKKSNAAVMAGWSPLVFTADDVKNLTAIETVKEFLATHTPF